MIHWKDDPQGSGVLVAADEKIGRIVDADEFVHGRMHDQKSGPQIPYRLGHGVNFEIVEEVLLDGKAPSAEFHFRRTSLLDFLHLAGEVADHMRRIRRRADGGNRPDAWNIARRDQDSSPAQGMAHQQ